MTDAQKVRHYKKYLRDLIGTIEDHTKAFDQIASRPQSFERGRALAAVMNSLSLQKDIAKRYGLNAPRAHGKGADGK